MYLNKATIIGNLTRDPELKSLPSGMKVTNFSIATNRTWKNKEGQKMEDVEFHNVVVFGRQAETSAQYLKKGSQCLIEGRLKTQSWDDTGTGKKMYRTEIVAENVQFGSKPSGTDTNVGNKTVSEEQSEMNNLVKGTDTVDYPEEDINPEDIPF